MLLVHMWITLVSVCDTPYNWLLLIMQKEDTYLVSHAHK